MTSALGSPGAGRLTPYPLFAVFLTMGGRGLVGLEWRGLAPCPCLPRVPEADLPPASRAAWVFRAFRSSDLLERRGLFRPHNTATG